MSAEEISLEEAFSGVSESTAQSDTPVFDAPQETADVQSVTPAEPALPVQSDTLAADDPATEVTASSDRIIHFVHDGFSLLGNVWESGQELVITPENYQATIDTTGKSVLDLDQNGQVVRYGKVIWLDGPAPAPEFAVETQVHADKLAEQARRPPVSIATVVPVQS